MWAQYIGEVEKLALEPSEIWRTVEQILHSQLGKMGDIHWAFANGYDDRW